MCMGVVESQNLLLYFKRYILLGSMMTMEKK